jgi:hypothetical protein
VILGGIAGCKSDAEKKALLALVEAAALHPEAFPKIDRVKLPTYLELQIHGTLEFGRDVEHVIVSAADLTALTAENRAAFKEKFDVSFYKLTEDGMVPV